MTLSIAVLASTKGTDMQAIIDEIEAGRLDAKIACIIADRQCYALERAQKHGIEAVCLDPAGKSREEFDRLAVAELEKRNVQLVLLIGYMRILSPYFTGKFRNRIMNIHPSLLPAFGGGMDKDVHQSVLNYGCKITGCTLHFVTELVDAGPVIFQKAVEVEENDTSDTLKEKVQKAEQEILIKAIRLFGEGKIRVEGSRARIIQ